MPEHARSSARPPSALGGRNGNFGPRRMRGEQKRNFEPDGCRGPAQEPPFPTLIPNLATGFYNLEPFWQPQVDPVVFDPAR